MPLNCTLEIISNNNAVEYRLFKILVWLSYFQSNIYIFYTFLFLFPVFFWIPLIFSIKNFFPRVQLIYNFVLVSGVQKSESVIHIHIQSLFLDFFFLHRPLVLLFILYIVVCIGEGNGNPLQCSCLENPRDGGAWWAAISGVTQSRIRLRRLSSSSSVYMSVPISQLILRLFITW